MVRKKIVAGILLALPTITFAQQATSAAALQLAPIVDSIVTTKPAEVKVEEKKPAFNFSANADVYYRYDFNRQVNNHTSFTNSHNSFELGMISARLDHSFGKVSMTADVGFGKRAEEFSYNDDKSKFLIKQLFVSYSPIENLKLSMGSWTTHVGYELVDAYANRNYSMSYMFSYGPFFHTGVKAEYTLGKHSFMLGVADPTDFKSASLGSKKFILGQWAFASEDSKLKTYLNYQSGQRPSDQAKIMQWDGVATYKFNDKFNMAYNGTIMSNKLYDEADKKYSDAKTWWGSALYFNADPSEWLGFTLRAEYFSDDEALSAFTGYDTGGNVLATTLSANFRIGNLTIIPEFRYEHSNQEYYSKHDGTLTKSDASVLIAATYKF
jgi:Putative beta-barrel porin-2, OmpL-like. bbp2